MSLRTVEVVNGEFGGRFELIRNAVVWQPIVAAGGLSSPPGGLKGRLQARLPATRSANIDASELQQAPETPR
jgi:hypothetical protein